MYKAKRPRRRVKKVAGTVLPKGDKILDRGLDRAEKKATMYAPTANMLTSMGKQYLTQNVGPFGTRWAGRLKYVDRFNMSNALGIYSEILFNLNSLFDPDRTGTGHQPLGFDNLATIFSRYRVLKTSYRITGTNTEQNQNLSVIVYADNGVASAGSCANALEHGWSQVKMRNGFSPASIFKGTVVLNKLTGNSLEAYRSDDAYTALVSGSPSELLLLHVGIEGSAAVASSFNYFLELEFDCEFWDPVMLPPS